MLTLWKKDFFVYIAGVTQTANLNYDSRHGPYIENRRKARNNSGNMTTLANTLNNTS